MSQNNASHTKLTLDEESNSSVTLDSNAYHTLTKSDREFIRQSLKINEVDKRPFSYLDFPNLTPENYRQKLRRNREHIEIVCKGHPTFYKIKGVELPLDNHNVTLQTTGVGLKFLDIIESLRLQQPTIHDIKIQFKSDLHKCLVDKGSSTHPNNHSIKTGFPCTDNNLTIVILIYPETTQVDIGCTYNPIVYNFKGILYLQELLAKISYHLSAQSGYTDIPPVSEWVMTHYHLGKDGPEINGQMFHVTLEEMAGGLMRFYSKKMPDGTVVPRLEQVKTEKLSIGEHLQSVLEIKS